MSAFRQIPSKLPSKQNTEINETAMEYASFLNNKIPEFEKPLATSSPIPKSLIPILNGTNANISKLPPPVAPKPKIVKIY